MLHSCLYKDCHYPLHCTMDDNPATSSEEEAVSLEIKSASRNRFEIPPRAITAARRKTKLHPASSSSTVTTVEDDEGDASDSAGSDEVAANTAADPVVLPQALSELRRLTSEHGPLHESVAEAWNSLGLIRLHMQRNAAEALQCHQRALEIYDQMQESVSLQVAVTLNDLAMCHERLQDRHAALALYERALATAQSAPCAAGKLFLFRSTERAIARLSHK